MRRRFRQVDVFTDVPYAGNPVAVVLDAEDLSAADMQRVASWTNLSETTFVLPPVAPGASYRLRIFTPSRELPFAGHPTLGSCHAWLETSGASGSVFIQECPAGLIPIRRTTAGLAFAAPPLLREGPVDEPLVGRVATGLGIERSAIVAAEWVDNGPGWIGVLLRDADSVLALRPGPVDLDIGVVGPYPDGAPEAFEVRAFMSGGAGSAEDPVTGSLNASLGQWLLGTGRATAPYVARQGTVLGRAGRVHVSTDAEGAVWVGGGTVTCISGHLDL
jgi:PhzF family phenazine biosynthesis protein